MKVYGLYYINDNPDSLENYKKVSDIVKSIWEYNKKHNNARFVWLQLDQEISKEELQDDFIDMLKIIEKESNKYWLINQVAIRPLWTRQDYKWENFSKVIFDNIDEWVIMAYDDELNIIENIANKSLFWNLDIWININKKTVKNETLYDEIKQNGLSWFENSIVNNLNKDYLSNTYFKWVSIHDYVSYFYLQNWVEPVNYVDNSNNSSNFSIKPQWNLVASYPKNKWPTYKSSNLILEINPWNIVYPAKGNAKMYYNWKTITYIQDLSNIKIQNAWGYVLGYPEVYVWNKPWNWNYVDAGSKLPAKIDELKSLQVEASWKYEHPSSLSCNFAMEGWFTKNKFQKTWVGAWEVEMMIMWYRNIQNAAGSKVWTSTIPVKVNGVNKNITFDIYKANIGWDFITFIPKNYKDFKNANISFDILDFTKVAEKYVPQIKNLYLEDWEFWTEYGTPSTTKAQFAWQITKFKVTWKKNNSDTSNNNQETWNTTTPSTLNYSFAPYVDTTLYPFPLLWDIAKQTNQYDYTLAFIVSKNWKCEASWGGYYDIEKWPSAWINWKEKFLYNELSYLKSKNWKLFVSFGGAAGTPLFKACSNKNDLVNQYKKVINKIWTKYLDFDVEWAVLADKNAVNNLIYALKDLQSNYNNNLEIWFTLPVMPEWLTQDGLYLVNKAKSEWLKFAGVNLMTMDYASSYNQDMGNYAIQAVKNTQKQIWNIAIWITPMIGLNDIITENFTLEDVKQVYNYTKQNQNVKRVSYWSLNRDHPCSKTSVDLKCSSKNNQTKDWEYLYAFRWNLGTNSNNNSWNTQNWSTSTSSSNQQTWWSSTNNWNQTTNNNNVETTNNDEAQNDVESTIDEMLSNLDKKYNIWKNKIQNLQFKKLNLHLGKYNKYYKLLEKFFNTKKEKILKNEKYINENYFNYLKSFNVYTNWLFTDIYYKNYSNIKSYLDWFKKVIRKLKKFC